MTDIVYLLGRGSSWNNQEIKYSIRSIEKHCKSFRNIYVIGILPEFLKNVIHIPFREKSRRASKNIVLKLLAACAIPELSDDFLYINDDHFMLKDFVAKDYPFYHRGSMYSVLASKPNITPYTQLLANTYLQLHEMKLPTLDFDVHTPIVFNKELFVNSMKQFNFNHRRYVVKSLYCNANHITGMKIQDCKFSHPHTVEYLKKEISERDCFSISVTVHDTYKQLLEELYPKPSSFEK